MLLTDSAYVETEIVIVYPHNGEILDQRTDGRTPFVKMCVVPLTCVRIMRRTVRMKSFNVSLVGAIPDSYVTTEKLAEPR